MAFATAARHRIVAGEVRGRAFMRACGYALFGFFPLALFAVHTYPAWYWHYLVDVRELNPGLVRLVALAIPPCCMLGFIVASRWMREGRSAMVPLLTALAFPLTAHLCLRERIQQVGSYGEWQVGVARDLWNHGPFLWDSFVVLVLLIGGFGVVLRMNANEKG